MSEQLGFLSKGYEPMRVFRKLAVNNVLANYRLAQSVMALPHDEFEAPRTGFFPSLKATLNHIYRVDWFYIDALMIGQLGRWPHNTDQPYQSAEALYAAQAELDIELFAYTRNMSWDIMPIEIEIDRGSRIQTERADDVLSHLFQHQTHHRGQAHAMLSGTPVKPPQLDEFIVADDAKFRMAELAALGWDETWLDFEPPPGFPRRDFPG